MTADAYLRALAEKTKALLASVPDPRPMISMLEAAVPTDSIAWTDPALADPVMTLICGNTLLRDRIVDRLAMGGAVMPLREVAPEETLADLLAGLRTLS